MKDAVLVLILSTQFPRQGRHLQAALSQPAPGPVDGAMWSSLPSCRAHGLASALGHGKEAKDRDLPQRNLLTQKGGDTNQFEDEEDSNQLVSLTLICLSRASSEGTQQKGVLPAPTLKGTDIGSRDQKVKIARHLGARGWVGLAPLAEKHEAEKAGSMDCVPPKYIFKT